MASSVAVTRKTSKQKGWQPEQDSGPEQTGAMLTVTVRGRSGGESIWFDLFDFLPCTVVLECFDFYNRFIQRWD